MRTAEIFNGNTLIKVNEGSRFKLNGVWHWDIGTNITFNVRQGIDVVAAVISKDGSGSELEVLSIKTKDDLADMIVEAQDVEVETIDSSVEEPEIVEKLVEEGVEELEIIEEPVEEVVDKTEEIEKLVVKKNKFTKKEVVSYIEDNKLDIDISKTKAELVKILEEKNLIEYK